jgi:hypothetical protein
MEPNYETMTATEIERSNTILWGALMAGCILISIILFMESQNQEFYNVENFYNSSFMWISIVIAIGGYYLGNMLYQKKAEEGATLSNLNEKINAFRASFILKAALLEGPTLIAIIFMMFEKNFYFLMIAAFLLIAQYLNRPTNERFFNDFKVNSAQKQELLDRGKV